MTQTELRDCKREVVAVHKEWKTAVASNDTPRATLLDEQCRELRTRIIAANRAGASTPESQ